MTVFLIGCSFCFDKNGNEVVMKAEEHDNTTQTGRRNTCVHGSCDRRYYGRRAYISRGTLAETCVEEKDMKILIDNSLLVANCFCDTAPTTCCALQWLKKTKAEEYGLIGILRAQSQSFMPCYQCCRLA